MSPVDQHAVYGSAAPGARTRAASAAADWARRRRHRRFRAIVQPDPGMRIVDLGCGSIGLRAWEPALNITGVDLRARPEYPGPFVQADVTSELPFADHQFDLAFCNSVIEHIPPASRPAFAAEVRRVAKGWWVQTPAYGFPIEPHALLPAAHWLPPRLRRVYWRLGVAASWEEIALLRRHELAALFGPEIVAERVGPLVKSWIAVRRPA
jgi:SAM-dependent methyltransferase